MGKSNASQYANFGSLPKLRHINTFIAGNWRFENSTNVQYELYSIIHRNNGVLCKDVSDRLKKFFFFEFL